MVQKLQSLPGILAGNDIRLLENADRPKGQILQIADGRTHQIETAFLLVHHSINPSLYILSASGLYSSPWL